MPRRNAAAIGLGPLHEERAGDRRPASRLAGSEQRTAHEPGGGFAEARRLAEAVEGSARPRRHVAESEDGIHMGAGPRPLAGPDLLGHQLLGLSAQPLGIGFADQVAQRDPPVLVERRAFFVRGRPDLDTVLCVRQRTQGVSSFFGQKFPSDKWI